MNIPSVGIKEATKGRVAKNKTAGGTFDHKQLSGIKRGGASQEFSLTLASLSLLQPHGDSFTRRELREEEILHKRKPSCWSQRL